MNAALGAAIVAVAAVYVFLGLKLKGKFTGLWFWMNYYSYVGCFGGPKGNEGLTFSLYEKSYYFYVAGFGSAKD